MKIRSGFVSNSSSSSFVMIGFSLPDASFDRELILKLMFGNNPDVKKLLDDIRLPKKKVRCCKHPEKNSEYCPKCGKPMWKEIEKNWDEEVELLLEEKLEKLGICLQEYMFSNELTIGYKFSIVEGEGTKSEKINLLEMAGKIEEIRSDLGLKLDYPVKIFNYVTSG